MKPIKNSTGVVNTIRPRNSVNSQLKTLAPVGTAMIDDMMPKTELTSALDRPPQMHVEAKPTFASGNVEIEAAIAEVQVPRWVEDIANRAQDLLIDMRADPKAADIAIGGETPAIAKLAVITRTDQRIGPAAARAYTHTRKQAGLSAPLHANPPA